jgi:hypothetical protein
LQRVHQNNMEFLSIFMPIFLLAGFENAINTAIAGVAIIVARQLFCFGYLKSAKARLIGK